MPTYTVNKQSDTPLYIQIRDSITTAIEDGSLSPGDKIPPVVALSKEIGVTQATVRRALKDLQKAGHTECYVGRGTFIKDATKVEPNTTSTGTDNQHSFPGPTPPVEHAARRLRTGINKALVDIMSLADKSGIIKLTAGVPDPSLLPEGFLENACTETLHQTKGGHLEPTDPQGSAALRSEIARRYSETGTAITAENVLITNGSIQALSLIAQSLLVDRPPITFETPCYTGMANSFAAMGHWVSTITRDQNGPLEDQIQDLAIDRPQLLYLCPYVHNPMGTDLSKERQVMISDWARQSNSTIITDEIFKDLKFKSTPNSSFFDSLGGKQTMVISSLSKSITTGLRVGWLISSVERVKKITQLKRLMDQSTPSLMQGISLSILTSGAYDHHVEKMQKIYKKRMQALVTALKQHMPEEITWTAPDGGFSILLSLPPGYSSISLFLTAIEKGVAFLPGPLFDIDQRFVNTFRLSCAWANEAYLQEGIELLADAVKEYILRPPGDLGLSGLGSFQ